MEEKKLLHRIHRHRWYILACMIVGLCAGVYVFDHYFNFYNATVTIYISGEPVVNKSDADDYYVDLSRMNEGWAIQEMLLYSNEMTGILNSTFKLYKHYRIDSTSKFAFDKLSSTLNKRIVLQHKNQFDLFELSFKDRDPDYAIRVVNFLSKKLDEMNKKLLVEKLKKKAGVYKMVLADLDKESDKILSKLSTQISALNQALKNINASSAQSDYILNLQTNLSNISADIRRVSQKTISATNAYQIAVKSVNEGDYPIIKVLEKATPKNIQAWIQFSFFGALGLLMAGVLYVCILYLLVLFESDMAIVFGKQT